MEEKQIQKQKQNKNLNTIINLYSALISGMRFQYTDTHTIAYLLDCEDKLITMKREGLKPEDYTFLYTAITVLNNIINDAKQELDELAKN